MNARNSKFPSFFKYSNFWIFNLRKYKILNTWSLFLRNLTSNIILYLSKVIFLQLQHNTEHDFLFYFFPFPFFLWGKKGGGGKRISLVILIKWNQVSRLKNLVNDPWLTFARVEKLGQRGASENVEWRGPWFRQGSFLN